MPLVRRLEDAILVLSRMGQRSNELMHRYITAIGDERSARARIAAHIERYVGTDPAIVQWLRTGITVDLARGQRSGDDLKRIADQQSDAAIALLMIDAQRLNDDLKLVGSSDRSSVPGNEVASFEYVLLAAERLASDVLALGRERGLEIRGKEGDRVEFNPAAHDPIASLPAEPVVTVVSPVVVRLSTMGREVVVLKGRVKA